MTSTTASDLGLQGMRVLIVEDSYLIAWSLRRMLSDLGCSVVGPAATVDQAIEMIEGDGCDAAILDVNLGAETSLPVAESLSSRGLPFFFVTGYSSPQLASIEFKSRRRLRKRHRRVSIERIVSGPAIVDIYETLAMLEGRAVTPLDDKAIWSRAMDREDSLAAAAVDR